MRLFRDPLTVNLLHNIVPTLLLLNIRSYCLVNRIKIIVNKNGITDEKVRSMKVFRRSFVGHTISGSLFAFYVNPAVPVCKVGDSVTYLRI